MPPQRKSPADKALRSIEQAIQAHVSGLSATDKQLVAQGLRRAAVRLEGQAQERANLHKKISALHWEKLRLCQVFLSERSVDCKIIYTSPDYPVLVAGPLKIAYNDETGKFMSEIYGITDAAFSHEALCLAAIERLKGKK